MPCRGRFMAGPQKLDLIRYCPSCPQKFPPLTSRATSPSALETARAGPGRTSPLQFSRGWSVLNPEGIYSRSSASFRSLPFSFFSFSLSSPRTFHKKELTSYRSTPWRASWKIKRPEPPSLQHLCIVAEGCQTDKGRNSAMTLAGGFACADMPIPFSQTKITG